MADVNTPVMMLDIQPDKSRTEREGRTYATVQVQGGKEVIPAKELINLAHKAGFMRSELELVAIDLREQTAAFIARVYFADGSMYSDVGDASPDNTNSMTAASYMRMAATRALSRALAQALNADTNAAEEIAPRQNDGDNQSFRGNTSRAPNTKRKSSDDDWE